MTRYHKIPSGSASCICCNCISLCGVLLRSHRLMVMHTTCWRPCLHCHGQTNQPGPCATRMPTCHTLGQGQADRQCPHSVHVRHLTPLCIPAGWVEGLYTLLNSCQPHMSWLLTPGLSIYLRHMCTQQATQVLALPRIKRLQLCLHQGHNLIAAKYSPPAKRHTPNSNAHTINIGMVVHRATLSSRFISSNTCTCDSNNNTP